MLNEAVINVLKNGMWDLATCANGESNVVPVAFKDVTEDGKLDTSAADTFSGLKISTKATQIWFPADTCSHIHFIGSTGNQLEYALDTSVEFTKANTDTETEIFIRQPSTYETDPESKFIFTRMYSRVYQAGCNGYR